MVSTVWAMPEAVSALAGPAQAVGGSAGVIDRLEAQLDPAALAGRTGADVDAQRLGQVLLQADQRLLEVGMHGGLGPPAPALRGGRAAPGPVLELAHRPALLHRGGGEARALGVV